MGHLLGLEHAVQEVHEWLNEIKAVCQWNNDAEAYAILRSVLQLLRDHLPLHSSIKLASQFSPLIRGLFYEGWRPIEQPMRERTEREFIDRLAEMLEQYKHTRIEPELAAVAVFKTLQTKIDPNEVKKILAQLPKGVRKIFSYSIDT